MSKRKEAKVEKVTAEAAVQQVLDEQHKAAAKKMAQQLREARSRYVACTTAAGERSLHNGDDVALLLASMEPDAVVAGVERALKLPAGELAAKYQRLNNGQRRMNAGNRLRNAIKRGVLTEQDAKKAVIGKS